MNHFCKPSDQKADWPEKITDSKRTRRYHAEIVKEDIAYGYYPYKSPASATQKYLDNNFAGWSEKHEFNP